MNAHRFAVSLAIATAALAAIAPAIAQTWPARPVTMVVVFAAGGTTDIVGRQLAAKLGSQLGQQVLVENRVGAGGVVGATAVARAKPDGYTMLMLTSTHAVGETLYKDRPYDLLRDFAPVTNIGTTPYWLLVTRRRCARAPSRNWLPARAPSPASSRMPPAVRAVSLTSRAR